MDEPSKRAKWIPVPTLEVGDDQQRPVVPQAFLERFDTSSLATQIPPNNLGTNGDNRTHNTVTVGTGFAPNSRPPPPTAPPSSAVPMRADILISSKQAENPIVKGKLLRNVTYAMVDGLPVDFHINAEVAALFLSMKWHMAHKLYILARLDQMVGYKKRILICFCDCEGTDAEMVDLATLCVAKNATLLVGWSLFECARYIEALKKFESATPELIKGETSSDFEDVFAQCLTSVRSVNSTDVVHIGTTFHTMERVALASVEELLLCPGLGAKKARRIHETFRQPFRPK